MANPIRTRPRIAFWVMLGLTIMLGLSILGLIGSLKVGADTATLRRGLTQSSVADWHKRIEVRVGPCILSLARLALAFVDLPPEARTALRSVRGAEVGFYQQDTALPRLDSAAKLDAADAAMSGRDWERLVTVVEERELVAVYVPRIIRSPRNVKVCVAVISGRDLVVVSARSNLEPLMELAAAAYRNNINLPLKHTSQPPAKLAGSSHFH